MSIRFLRLLFSTCLLSCATIGIGASSVGFVLLKDEANKLPSVENLKDPVPLYATRIYSSNGELQGEFAENRRSPLTLEHIPLLVQNAFISAEDQDFWHHHGIDFMAIARAGVFDLKHKHSHRPIGASTITQQVVKNMINGDEKTLERKIKEALLAVRLENKFGKKKILEFYLNDIYLGYGAFGVNSASEVYFQKPLTDLSIAEVAFLAILPKGPSNYDPLKHPKAVRDRRHYVLNRMYVDGYITKNQMDIADNADLPIPVKNTKAGVADNYFTEEVRRELVSKMGSDSVYKKGLIVKTSLDSDIQKISDNALRDGLIAYDKRHGWRGILGKIDITTNWKSALSEYDIVTGNDDYQPAVILENHKGSVTIGLIDGSTSMMEQKSVAWTGLNINRMFNSGDVIMVNHINDGYELFQLPKVQGAVVIMDVHTGRVLAVSGGFSHDLSSFNRATQSYRQIGSTFKPFIFLTGFENGYDPISPVLDTPIAIDPGQGSPIWRPGADGGHGWGVITARKALENSRNLASVRMLYDLGIPSVEKTAQDFDIYKSISNYASALGAQETTDLRLTTAYSMLANGGYRIYPTFIDSIETSDGNIVAQRPAIDTKNIVADPLSVARITSVLQGVVKHGTAYRALGKIDTAIAGKTGTSNDNVDAWFVGYTPQLAIGVHIGFDKPEPLGKYEFGGLAAAPVFGDIINKLPEKFKEKEFSLPENMEKVQVDPISGNIVKRGGDENIIYKENVSNNSVKENAQSDEDINENNSDQD